MMIISVQLRKPRLQIVFFLQMLSLSVGSSFAGARVRARANVGAEKERRGGSTEKSKEARSLNARRQERMFLLQIISEILMTPHPQDGLQKNGRHASCAQDAVPVGTEIARIQQKQSPAEKVREASTTS